MKEITTVVDDKPVKQYNPAYTPWVARDQAVLGYLLSTLTRETLMHVSRVLWLPRCGGCLLICIHPRHGRDQ
jgi:hypothetical protein